MKEKFNVQKARQICERIKGYEDPDAGNGADFAAAMKLPAALDRIGELEQALVEERTWFLAAEDGHHLEDLSELVSFPGEKSRYEYSEEAREQLEKEGLL